MLGFVWSESSKPCLVFLFPGFLLTDAAKFWLAAVGTVAAGIFAEFLVALRRWEAKKVSASRVRKVMRLLLYSLTRTVGYLVMLMAMTYSAEIFLAVVLGLTIGFGLFNLRAAP